MKKTSEDKLNICHVRSGLDDFERKWTCRDVCKDLPAEHLFKTKHYCILHLPSNKKSIHFEEIVNERLKKNECNFRYVYFPRSLTIRSQKIEKGVSFIHSYFNDSIEIDNVIFNSTFHFTAAVVKGFATFENNTFNSDVYFANPYFENSVDFRQSTFKGENHFSGAVFKEWVSFHKSNFDNGSTVFFDATDFKSSVSFGNAFIKGHILFQGKNEKRLFDEFNSKVSLSFAQIETPKKIVFRNVTLYPSWFINIDVNSISFVDVKWVNSDGSVKSVLKEMESLENERMSLLEGIFDDSEIHNPIKLFLITCRQLAENAESNNRFEEASKFRQMAFECERLERNDRISKWWNDPISCSNFLSRLSDKIKTFPFDFFHWAYRWSSGYGENRLWAFFVLFLIVFISAILYVTPLCEFSSGQNGVRSLEFWESIAYSLRVMILQRPEPFPTNSLGKIVLALESVFAPLQLALLALAIRRKFMR